MSERIHVNGKHFVKYISEADILQRIEELGQEITIDYAGKNPVFIAVLNGAFMFAADLFKTFDFPCEITFVKLASYQGTASTGNVKTVIGLNLDIEDRPVIILEDIVDSGKTLSDFIPQLQEKKPASVEVATLLIKPDSLKYNVVIRYKGFSIPNEFIIGYGLDYDQQGRNFRDIYQVDEKA